MQNDLVWFEFRNTDNTNPWLDPTAIAETANALEAALSTIVAHVEVAQALISGGTVLPIRVYLADARHGSINFGFQIVILEENSSRRDLRSKMVDYATILSALLGVLAFCGISLGNMRPEGPQSVDKNDAVTPQSMTVVEDPRVRRAIEQFTMAALNSGSDEVFLTIPDHPTCQLVLDESNPLQLGSSAAPVTAPWLGKLEVELVLTENPIEIATDEGLREMYVGRITAPIPPGADRIHQQHTFTVLVDWRSKREKPPLDADPITVNGELLTFLPQKYKANTRIGKAHRSVQGVFIVETRRVDE